MAVKIPDRGYCISRHGRRHGYEACYRKKAVARRAAQRLANKTREPVDLIQVQDRGRLRFLAGEIFPKGW